jgi:dipeptidyl aminopeptidase/acylaminoacyl peptidase
MQNAAPVHPSREVLEGFALGKLSPDQAAAIESHLADCTECGLAVQQTPADNFVGLVRSAHVLVAPSPVPRGAALTATPTPNADSSLRVAAVTGGSRTETAQASVEAPPELADHPRYRIEALLGRGGMGAVYKAEHRLMERWVALKIIGHDLSARPELVERFRREVKAAARLSHPNIVTAHDAEQAGATHFLVMEFIEGTDLARLVGERGPLPAADACGYVRQAALGLQHAHEQGMIHRDIKPHNLMLTPAGQVKILDFGLARFAHEAREQAGAVTLLGAVMGTPDYMAPEQATDSHRADIRADIYSLGCTLYHLLSGRVPFPHDSTLGKVVRHATEQPTPLGELRPELPPGLVSVVDRMMAKKPEERYQTPAEVAEALGPFAGPAAGLAEQGAVVPASRHGDHTVNTSTTAGGISRWRNWGRPLTALAAAVLLIAGVVLLTKMQSRGRPVLTEEHNPADQVAGSAAQAMYCLCSVPVDLEGKRKKISLLALDGTALRHVKDMTDATVQEPDAAWSPDGRRIAFCADRKRFASVHVMDADGGNPHALTDRPLSCRQPTWSPDGKRIAFTASTKAAGTGEDIYVMNSDGSGVTQLTTSHGTAADPAWSPDGRRIVFVLQRACEGFHLCTIPAAGGDVQRLASKPPSPQYPAWAPDGRRIVYGAIAGDTRQLFLCDRDGTHVQQLTRLLGSSSWASWSPDGRYIYFWYGGLGAERCCRIRPDGSGLQELNVPAKVSATRFSWMPRPRDETKE